MPELRCLLLAAGLVAAGIGYSAERDSVLRTNPFLRPASVSTSGSDSAQASDGVTLELRATTVAGDNSQANIGGVILGLGEEVNGYRLTEVHQRRVVLDRDGTQKELGIEDENRNRD